MANFSTHLMSAVVALAPAGTLVWLLSGPLAERFAPPAEEPEPAERPVVEAPDLTVADFAEQWKVAAPRRGPVELPRGVPMPLYALQISQWLDSKGCRADSLREDRGKLVVNYVCPPNPPRAVSFVRGGRFLPGSVRIALLFRTDGMAIPALAELDLLENPYALIVDPLREDASLEQDLKRLRRSRPDATVLALRMKESGKFTALENSGAVYPQLSGEEIRRRVAALFERRPDAVGVTPTGSRVPLGYESVTEAIADELEARSAMLLLAPQHRSPALAATCARRPGLCLEMGGTTDTLRAEETLRAGVEEAKRRGSKILALPTTVSALRGARALERDALDSGWVVESVARFKPATPESGGRP